MKQSARESLDAYYREAGSWADDQQDAMRSSRKAAWTVAIVAGALALLEAIALVVLLPLKTVVPYTLMVDKTTGYVQELKPIDAAKIAPDTALTQSFLVQYVIAREEYDFNTLQTDYRKVQLWSAGAAKTDYVNGMQSANPASPQNRYQRNSVLDVRVKSVTSLSATSALVRFDTVRRDSGGQWQSPEAWVAVIDYRFSTGPMSTEDRYINPLGFQVSKYRRDPETAGSQPLAPPPASNFVPEQPLPQPATPITPGVSPPPAAAPTPEVQL